MLTDLLILSVLQLGRVVEHAEHSDDEVEQGEDAVQPQKSVPARGKPQMSEVVSAACLHGQLTMNLFFVVALCNLINATTNATPTAMPC